MQSIFSHRQLPFSGSCFAVSGRTCQVSNHAAPSKQQRFRTPLAITARAATAPGPTGRSERAVNFNPSPSGASLDTNGTAPSTKTFGSFDSMIEGNDLPVLVDFHAHWCGPCQMMGQVVGTLSKRLDGAVTCVRIDCDKYPALASRYNVQALPTLVLFKDGKPIDKVEGYVGLQPLLDRVNYFLGRPMGPGRRFNGARN